MQQRAADVQVHRPTTHGPATREQEQLVTAATTMTPAERHAAARSVPLGQGGARRAAR